MATILIIDDDIAILTSLSVLLKNNGHNPVTVETVAFAQQYIQKGNADLVLLDMNLTEKTTGEDGLALLNQIKEKWPLTPVILITAWGSIELAVKGMKQGAFDFINKPWENSSLLKSVNTALTVTQSRDPVSELKREKLDKIYDFRGIIGENGEFIKMLDTLGRICRTDASVIICGESGTGKELIAEAIHLNSHRSDKPFVKVNLGGIQPALFESEMFGHVKGAFTDARHDRKGRFQMADNGTIFLDEIGEVDQSNQVKLLRVLQNQSFEVLGSSRTETVNVRVISATNRNLEEMVAEGLFREDLFFRINLIKLEVPSLHDRRDDIPLLVNHFLKDAEKRYDTEPLSVSSNAMNWLMDYHWPGNIRELKNMIERTVLVTGKSTLSLEDFATQAGDNQLKVQPSQLPAVGTVSLNEMEREMIQKTLEFYDGNMSQAARALGLSRGALYRRIEKHRIDI